MANFNFEEYQAASDWKSIPKEYLESSLEESIEADEFPGLVLPAWVRGKICWYGFAPDQRQWRKLQPILLAYVGHTVTTFTGEPAEIADGEPVEAYLASLKPYAIARLTAPNNERFASRALHRMKNSLFARPKNLRPPPMSTAQILADFDMCLVEGDREGAIAWLDRLRSEFRLDAINLEFSNVRLNAAFSDWAAIGETPTTFNDICRIRKPSVITHYLFEAIWYLYLDGVQSDNSLHSSLYESECKSNVADLLASSGVPSKWVADNFGPYFEKYHVDEMASLGPTATEGVLVQKHYDRNDSVEIESKYERDESERKLLDGVRLEDRGAIEGGQDSLPSEPIEDWFAWLDALSIRDFRHFREVAENLAINFAALDFQDPEDINSLVESIYDLDIDRAVSRLNCTLPVLLKWAKSDSNYPRKEMLPFYEVLLMRLFEAQNRGGEFREAFSELITAMLEVGLSDGEYRSLVDNIAQAVPSGAGIGDVFWLLDIAEVLCRFTAENEGARKTALNNILNSLEPVTRQMSSVQMKAYLKISSIAGWDPITRVEDEEDVTVAEKLKGKFVGIYTLTESAGRQAEAILKGLSPDIRVELSFEKVCTPRLTRLSQNADIMVVTASSATHAATDCIHKSRETDRILFAAGRGCCSILRAIDDHIVRL